jgi:hypothetical protein
MNTEPNGGTGDAGDELRERLTRRFDAELAQAQRDYPNLGVARRTGAAGARAGSGHMWPRLASGLVAVGVFAVVGLIGVGLASKPVQVAGPADSGLAAAGIPTEIDGQKVYLVTDHPDWATTGSFLIGGYLPGGTLLACPQPSGEPQAQLDLAPSCGMGLLTDAPGDGGSQGIQLAPKTASMYSGWLGAPVVLRAHLNDTESTQCPADIREQCQKSLVVEAVVWPTVPSELDGQKVYRAADRASFPASGSFLLGGRVSKPDVMPPCPARIDQTQAEQQLIPYCVVFSIDGLGIAPKSNAGFFDEPKNEIVIARVHVNDSQAAGCPASTLEQCKSGIVVESVVWRSSVLIDAMASSSPSSVSSAAPSASSQVAVGTGEGVGPVPSETPAISLPPTPGPSSEPSIGPDANGVPASYGGQTVYRASSLPADAGFLLGGVLGRDSTCAAPTGVSAKPPACGYWKVDGLAVGNMVSIPDSLIGSVVVVEIQRSKTLGVCAGGPCRTTEILVVTRIVWSGSAAVEFPPFPIALPS